MKLTEIQDLIKFVAKSGVNEVELETKDVKIVIRTNKGKGEQQQVVVQSSTPYVQPAIQNTMPVISTTTQSSPPPSSSAPAADNSKYVTIKSPMIGTFYRSSSPDKPAFVNVGDDISTGKVICIIEAMKLFNEIEAEIKGKIVKILVDDATPVEYDQPLFLVDPS